jgi:xylulokinase
MPLVLGVDSSTQATKVELRDSDDGKVFGSGRAEHPPAHSPISEQDPMEWWQALVEARHDAGGALGVAAVAVAAQQHGLVVVDESAKVIRAAKLWNDTEAERDASGLIEKLGGPDEWVQACGFVPTATHAVAKLAWMRRNEREAFDRAAKLLMPHDWLTFRLSRQVVTDRGDASATGYWSPREEQWAPELLELVDDSRDWSRSLPRVLQPNEAAGDREGVLIAAGTGESMAAALGLGVRPRDVVISMNGGASVFTIRERPTEDPNRVVMGLADATGRFMPLVQTSAALTVIDVFARVLDVDARRFDSLALAAPPGAGGMTFVPGAGSAGGALHGIPDNASPELIARAVVEGIVCSLLDSLDALRAADVPVGGRLFLIGDGARGHAFQQVLADLTERAIAIPKGDRVATGACVQAAATLSQAQPDEIAAAWGLDRAREMEPNPNVDAAEVRGRYREARGERYEARHDDADGEGRDEGRDELGDEHRNETRDERSIERRDEPKHERREGRRIEPREDGRLGRRDQR